MSRQSGARRAAADVAAQLVGRVVNLLLGSVVIVLLTRELRVEGFGQWSTIFAICQIIGYVGELGLEPAAVRAAAAEPDAESETLGALLVLRLLLAVPATAASVVTIILLASTPEMITAGLYVAAATFTGAPAALGVIFQLRVRNVVPVAVMTLNSLMWTGAVAVLAATGLSGLVPFAAALLASQSISTAVEAGLALRAAPVRFTAIRSRMGALLRVGAVLGVSQLLNFSYVRVDQVLVLHYTDARQAGLYGAAYQLLDKAQFLPTALLTTLLPMLVVAYTADRQRLHRLVALGIEFLALFSFPVLAFAIVAGEPFIVLLFGADFRAAGTVLPILMGAFVLASFGYMVGNLVLVVGAQGRLVAITSAALVFNVVANVLLLPRFGYEAAAWITLATEVLVLSLGIPLTLGRLRIGVSIGKLARLALAATAMAAVLGGLRALDLNIWYLLVSAPIAYAVSVLVLRAVDIGDLKATLRRQA